MDKDDLNLIEPVPEPNNSRDGSSAQGKQSVMGAERPMSRSSILSRRLVDIIRSSGTIIRRTEALVSTSEGQDCFLGSIEYACHGLHYLIASRALVKLQRGLLFAFRRRILRQKGVRLAPVHTSPDSSSFLLSLSSLLSETRFALRLLGLFPIWKEGTEMIENASSDFTTNLLNACQIASIAVYQLLENIAFLGSKDIIPPRWMKRLGGIDNLYLWSIRGLLAHFVVLLVKLARERPLGDKNANKDVSSTAQTVNSEESSKEKDDEDDPDVRRREWRKNLVSYFLWTVLCVHWSVPHEVQIMEKSEGGLSFLADFFLLRDSWRGTSG